MSDRRRHPRVPAQIPAKIVFDCFSAVDCVIRDLSDGGARLELQPAGLVPRIFELVADGPDGFRTCEVVWRARDRVGVSFRWWWMSAACEPAGEGSEATV